MLPLATLPLATVLLAMLPPPPAERQASAAPRRGGVCGAPVLLLAVSPSSPDQRPLSWPLPSWERAVANDASEGACASGATGSRAGVLTTAAPCASGAAGCGPTGAATGDAGGPGGGWPRRMRRRAR
jgi:hypothetical protein